MRILRKIIRYLDQAEDIAVFLICILFFLVGLYGLYDSYLIYQKANDTSLLKYKHIYGDGEEEDKRIQGNMVAWLTLYDTDIDYPVMQGEDNTEYLSKDPYGDYSLSGSIFLDSRNAPDFSDDYSLIYGHHMDGGLMFGALDEYLDEEYFHTHRRGELLVDNIIYEIQIFAVAETEATNEMVFAPTETSLTDTLSYVSKHAEFFDEQMLGDNDAPILALSTCKYPDTADRTIVFGILSPDAERDH